VGLNILAEIRERYRCPAGLSDHTMTIEAPIAAVALGASVIEKHLTFSRAMYGSDAAHSLEPGEFRQMTAAIRSVEAMLAHPVDKTDASHLQTMKHTFEKSVVSLQDIPKGATITANMVGLKKPGTGIPGWRLEQVIGSAAARAIAKDTVLSENDIVWAPRSPANGVL